MKVVVVFSNGEKEVFQDIDLIKVGEEYIYLKWDIGEAFLFKKNVNYFFTERK